MERAPPVAIVPIIALILLAPAHGDSWTGPEALLDVGVQSWLVIKDVHEETVATGHGGTEKVLDYVIAEYRAYIRAKEPGKPVTLHALLPEGTEVLEARFYPTTTVLSDRFGVRWERAEPVGRIKGHLGVPRREMEVDPTRLPGRPEARSQGSDLLLGAGPEAQDPAVHRVPNFRMYYPKHYREVLRSLYDYWVIEWPVPAQPGRDIGFYLRSDPDGIGAWVELFAWPGGVTLESDGIHQVYLTDHLVLVLPEARVGVVGVNPVSQSLDEYERRRAEVARYEWPQVTRRFGFPYVPVVAVIGVQRLKVHLEIKAPHRVSAGSRVIVYAQPYLVTLDYQPMGYPSRGVLRFRLEDNRGSTRKLGKVRLPEGYGFGGCVAFEFRAPRRPGLYTLIVEYEGPLGKAQASTVFQVEGGGWNHGEAPVPVVPVIPVRRVRRAPA